MPNEQYYVRWRGKLTGPFEFEQLKEMAAQGRLTKLHDISTDRTEWRRAGALEDLYPPYALNVSPIPAAAPPESAAAQVAVAPEQPSQYLHEQLHEEEAEQTVEQPAEVQEAAADWYYSRDQRVEGPYATRVIAQFIAEGRLGPDDYVSPSADPSAWQLIGNVPEFAVVAPQFAAEAAAVPYAHPAAEPVPVANGDRERYLQLAERSLKLGVVGVVVPVCGEIGLIFALRARSGLRAVGDRGGMSTTVAGLALGIIDIVLDVAKLALGVYFVLRLVG